jgi:Tol biopolymer transport system component
VTTLVNSVDPVTSGNTTRPRRIERFDLLLAGVIGALLIAIGGIISGGDRAGVGISLLDLDGNAVSTTALTLPAGASIQLRFSELMDTSSIHVSLMPDLPRTVRWSGSTLIVTPLPALTPGQHYTLALEPGAHAQTGRLVAQGTDWQISVAPLRVVYMAPAIPTPANHIVNLWLVSTDGHGTPMALTHSSYGVDDFAVSPDGRQIVFTQRDAHGKTDLFLLNVSNDSIRQITRCVDAPCRAPVWSPDATRLLYERADSTAPDSSVRAWLLDLKTLQTTPLFADSRWLGKTPRWSPDGSTVSVYDKTAGGIFIVDMATGDRSLLQTLEDDAGQFAPGQRQQLVFRQLATTPQGAVRQLAVADYSDHTIRPLPASDGAMTDDPVAIWQPDGKQLTVMRRYFDQRSTEGAQIYSVDSQTGDLTPLVVDAAYTHGALSWSPDGGQLLMQRYPMGNSSGNPNNSTSLWRYDAGSKTLTQIAINGFLPQWLP